MQVSFLLDENIAASLADNLDEAGHDVERVVGVSYLKALRTPRFACTPSGRVVSSLPATTTASRCRPIHTLACSTPSTSRFPHATSTTPSNALSRRFPIERRWAQSRTSPPTGCESAVLNHSVDRSCGLKQESERLPESPVGGGSPTTAYEYASLNARSRRISSSTPCSRIPRPSAVGR